MGALAYKQGDLAAAEAHFGRSLELLRKTAEPPARDVALALNNLAILAWRRADFTTADRRYREALVEELDEKIDHPVGGPGLAVGPVGSALELDGEVLGLRAGALLAHREVGDDGEDDGQQGESRRERGNLQAPAAQAGAVAPAGTTGGAARTTPATPARRRRVARGSRTGSRPIPRARLPSPAARPATASSRRRSPSRARSSGPFST